MRTAAICPTCATYENAVCVIYNGPTLSNINIPPLTDLETALGSIDASVGSVIALINAVAANPIFLTTNGTSGPATVSGNVLNVPNYQPTLQEVLTNGNHTDKIIYVEDSVVSPVNTVEISNVATPQINMDAASDNWNIFLGALTQYVPKVAVSNSTTGYSGTLYENLLTIEDSLQTTKTQYGVYNFAIINTSNGDTSSINYPTTSSNSTIYFPNGSGTLVTSVNGTAPDSTGNVTISVGGDYLVYTALIDYNAGSPTATVLKNTLGANITWSTIVGTEGYIRGTIASGSPFTSKTWISSGSLIDGGDSYFVYGKRRNLFPTTQIEYYIYKYDNTHVTTPNFTSLSVEIRVYP